MIKARTLFVCNAFFLLSKECHLISKRTYPPAMLTRYSPSKMKSGHELLLLGRQTWHSNSEYHEVWGSGNSVREHEFWFVWGGQGTLTCSEGKQFGLHPGTALILLPGVVYEVKQNPHAPLSINFFSLQLSPLPAKLRACEMFLPHADFNLYEGVTRRVLELYWSAYALVGWKPSPAAPRPKFTDEQEYIRTGAFCPNPISMTITPTAKKNPVLRTATSLLVALIDEFFLSLTSPTVSPRARGTDRRHRDTMMQIAARLRRSPEFLWSVSALSREAGYSPDHFGRVFHKVLGCAPKIYLMNARIERARHMLSETGHTVKEIAHELGYNSPYFFSRQFKQVTGVSPVEYRKSATS